MAGKEETSFEEKMQNLEGIVQELESGKLNLDDSMKKFEEGMKLSKKCTDYLDKAEKKITLLVQGNDGELKEEAF